MITNRWVDVVSVLIDSNITTKLRGASGGEIGGPPIFVESPIAGQPVNFFVVVCVCSYTVSKFLETTITNTWFLNEGARLSITATASSPLWAAGSAAASAATRASRTALSCCERIS